MSTKSTSASGRYIFFRSLLQFPDSWLYPAIPDATSRLRSLGSQISINRAYNKRSQEFLDRIQHYLDFIQSMASNLRANELAFLQQQLTILAKDDNQKNEELIQLLQSFSNTKVDYLKLISLMNSLMQEPVQYSESLSNQINRMTMAKETWESFGNNNTWLIKKYEEKYKQYSAIYASKIKQQHKTITEDGKTLDLYGQSISEALAKKANEVLRGLSNNDQFIQQFSEQFATKQEKMSDNDLKNLIINLVADAVVNSPLETDASEILNRILTTNEESMLQLIDTLDDVEFSRIVVADFPELEQLALTTKKSLGKHIEQLDDRSINNILNVKEYQVAQDLIQELRSASNLTDQRKQYLYTQISRVLKDAIKKRAQTILKTNKIKDPMSRSEFNNAFGKISDFITPTQFRNSLQSSLKGVTFSHDTIGEILASNDVRKQIQNVLVNNLPGISISFKADIRYSTGYVGSNDIQIDDKHFKKIQNAINTVIKDHYSSFLTQYKDRTGGATDVRAAQEVYKEWLSQMKNHLDNIIDNDQELKNRFQDKTQMYKEFYETFSNSVSVKDYSLYNNTLGFHGGSLGSHSAPEKVIDNITAMYELGGISSADAEELLFAVLNCAPSMLGSGLKTSLEVYLLGGAALIMFDDSFAAADKFLEQLTDEFKGQKIVNIYRINTFYVPASFVLEEIHASLTKIYQELNTEISLTEEHNRVTIINNIEYSDSIAVGKNPQEKAEAVSTYVQSNIDIQFSFMGGLLDILESLPEITVIK